MAGKIFIARQSGLIILDGERVVVSAGHTRVREGHPLLKGNEEMFEPLTVHFDVENARANPGEKRERSPRSAKAAKSAAPVDPPAPTPGDGDGDKTPSGADVVEAAPEKPKRAPRKTAAKKTAASKADAQETGSE